VRNARGGKWKGKQLLPDPWIDKIKHASIDMHFPEDPGLRYSNLFWVLPDEHVYVANGLYGQKEKELPVHLKLEELLDEYLTATGLDKAPQSPLFPAAIGKTGKLSRRPLARTDAADMLKRRLRQAGLPGAPFAPLVLGDRYSEFLKNDGTLEAAQRIAGHADSRTTKLYDRRGQKVLLEDMERIRY
jgi:site-specific recombinase XerC